MSVFVDSSIWFAAVIAKDKDNARAKALLQSLDARVTTDLIVVETWALIDRKFNHSAAERFWGNIRRGAARVEPVLPVDFERAWAIGTAFPDQRFSLVDRTSFAVIERLGLTRVATLDDDFSVYRYGRNRERSFEIMR